MSDERFVERCRQEARTLHHDLRATDPARARAAAVRFAQLPQFAAVALDDLVAGKVPVRRAEAQQVVALAHGFVSWYALLETSLPELHRLPMHHDRMGAYVNRWFTTYEEAAASLAADGGYLLPYRKQFFVTAFDAVRELGLDPADPDWARIGFDWVRPRDAEAHLRLCRARLAAMQERREELP